MFSEQLLDLHVVHHRVVTKHDRSTSILFDFSSRVHHDGTPQGQAIKNEHQEEAIADDAMRCKQLDLWAAQTFNSIMIFHTPFCAFDSDCYCQT